MQSEDGLMFYVLFLSFAYINVDFTQFLLITVFIYDLCSHDHIDDGSVVDKVYYYLETTLLNFPCSNFEPANRC